jgi:short-subunit dehydrogenase
VFGLVGVPSQSAYCATKFAVRGFSDALRAELHGSNVAVTCVHPGGINTNIAKNARTKDEERRGRVVDFFARNTMPAAGAAQRIVEGIERKKNRVLIAKEAYFIDAMKRAFPVLTDALVARGQHRVPGGS